MFSALYCANVAILGMPDFAFRAAAVLAKLDHSLYHLFERVHQVEIGRERMNSALDGLRVLDFTTTIAGPHCARMLADLGAEVIKIEAPQGDMMRTRPPLRNGASTSFGQLNAGKKSISLDLKSPDAVEAARRLVATADVVVENFRPGVMRRFGLD